MDANSESTPLSIRDLLPTPDLHKLDWLPKGGSRFSPGTFLANLKTALKNPKSTLPIFTVISITAASANPLDVDPYPFWRDLILGPPTQSQRPFDREPTLEKKADQIVNLAPPDRPTETRVQKFSVEDMLFKNFLDEEKATAEAEIAEQIKIYKNAAGVQRAVRVLDWENTTLKPILELDVEAKGHKFWSDFLSAIVYVESGGVSSATSEVGIVGLAQISEATAAATARQYRIASFDLRRGWDSLRLSRFHLQDLMERFGEDISLLGYYGGQSFADKNVLAALKRKGVPHDDSIMKNGITSNQQLRMYIDHYGINIFNLGSADGEEYFKKFVAALRILKEVRGN